MKKVLLFAVFWFICFTSIHAQSVSNVRAQQDGENVIITYKLEGKAELRFTVELFISTDGGKTFNGPLKSVSGDVGKDISPGYKRISWDALSEMDVLDKDIKFKVEAKYKTIKNSIIANNYLGYDFISSAPFGYTSGSIGKNWGFYRSIKTGYKFGYDYEMWIQDSLAGYIPLVDAGTYSFTGNTKNHVFSIMMGPTYQIANRFVFHAGIGAAYRNSTREIKLNYVRYANVRVIEYSGIKLAYELGAKVRLHKYYAGVNLAFIRPGMTQLGFSVGFMLQD